MASAPSEDNTKTSITPLLKRLWHESAATKPNATEISAALSLIFTNSLSEVQTGALLTCLHFTDRDRQADVLAKCADAMRTYATSIDTAGLGALLAKRGRREGGYHGGLVCLILNQITSSCCLYLNNIRTLRLTESSV
jgi:anthranilate phosphoribosyltransferase